jgi:hypothetical protein
VESGTISQDKITKVFFEGFFFSIYYFLIGGDEFSPWFIARKTSALSHLTLPLTQFVLGMQNVVQYIGTKEDREFMQQYEFAFSSGSHRGKQAPPSSSTPLPLHPPHPQTHTHTHIPLHSPTNTHARARKPHPIGD